jgi:hypothetical protein
MVTARQALRPSVLPSRTLRKTEFHCLRRLLEQPQLQLGPHFQPACPLREYHGREVVALAIAALFEEQARTPMVPYPPI